MPLFQPKSSRSPFRSPSPARKPARNPTTTKRASPFRVWHKLFSSSSPLSPSTTKTPTTEATMEPSVHTQESYVLQCERQDDGVISIMTDDMSVDDLSMQPDPRVQGTVITNTRAQRSEEDDVMPLQIRCRKENDDLISVVSMDELEELGYQRQMSFLQVYDFDEQPEEEIEGLRILMGLQAQESTLDLYAFDEDERPAQTTTPLPLEFQTTNQSKRTLYSYVGEDYSMELNTLFEDDVYLEI